MFRSLAYALLVLFALCAPASAQLGRTSPPPPKYQPLIDNAVRAFQRGRFQDSLDMYRDAHDMWPNARALRAVGRCQYELGDYLGAYATINEAMSTHVRPLDGNQRQETEVLLRRVREHLGRLVVLTDPSSAQVHIDGITPSREDDGSYMVEAGTHSIEASATGYLATQRDVDVPAQGEQRVELKLASLVAQAATPRMPANDYDPGRSDEPLRKKWWVWASAGAAVVAAAVVTGVLVSRDDPAPKRPGGGTSGVAIGVPAASP